LQHPRIEGLDGRQGVPYPGRIRADRSRRGLSGEALEAGRYLRQIVFDFGFHDVPQGLHLLDKLFEEDPLTLDISPQALQAGRGESGARHRHHQREEEAMADPAEQTRPHGRDEEDDAEPDREERCEVGMPHGRPE
jgi:hypothetical protein